MTQRRAHFEIVKRPQTYHDGRGSIKTEQLYHWRIVGANGRILCASETYVRRADCLKACRRAMGARRIVEVG